MRRGLSVGVYLTEIVMPKKRLREEPYFFKAALLTSSMAGVLASYTHIGVG
jgi:hypothetical protein